MKYIIIGLGNYGGVLAEELTTLGHEVIGADSNEERVDSLKDKIATAFVLDATDEHALSALPIKTVDVVIVAIGENLGASIRVVSLLKLNKVKHIYARAVDNIHKAILEAFSLDKILTPENDAARELVQLLDMGIKIESFKVDDHYYVMKFKVSEKFVGFNINELNLDKDFNLKLIAVKRARQITNCVGVSVLERRVDNQVPEDYIVAEEDELVCYGRYKDFLALWKAL